jgi:hypothetical protein
MSDKDQASEILIPIPADRQEAPDDGRSIAGASPALAASARSSGQATTQDFQRVTEAQPGQNANDPCSKNDLSSGSSAYDAGL